MSKRKSSILVPFAIGAVLFAAYVFLRSHPIVIGSFGDVREQIFGRKLRGLEFVAIAVLIVAAVRALDRLLFDVLASRKKDVRAPQLLREISSILLYFVLFGWAGALLFENFSVAGFLATGSVLAVILGFALQDTLGNLFAGIALHMEDSFTIGDVIRSGENIGVVEGIRWRGTRLRTFNNSIITLPNSVIARERLEIFPRGNLNARLVTVSADYGVPPAVVLGILQRAAMNVNGVSQEIPALARVGGFGESGVVYEIKYWMQDYSQRDAIDAEIRQAIWYAFKRNGIAIPFPVRAVHRYQAPQRNDHSLSDQQIAGLLNEIDFLSPLPGTAMTALAENAVVRFYPRGETIIRRGDAGDSMFIVHEGTVSIRIPDDGGNHIQEVAEVGPGEVFGEMALLTGQSRSAHSVAKTNVTAVEITKAALEPVLQEHPELAAIISAKVVERRDSLDAVRASYRDEQATTLLQRIRDYFRI